MNLPKQFFELLVDISAQQEEIQEESNPLLKHTFRRSTFIGGREVELFGQQQAVAQTLRNTFSGGLK